jgi:hypothetical protein
MVEIIQNEFLIDIYMLRNKNTMIIIIYYYLKYIDIKYYF